MREGLVQAMKPELNKIFKPAFLGRHGDRALLPDARRGAEADHPAEAGKIQRRLRRRMRSRSTTTKLAGEVAERCTEVESGARNVDNILSNTLLPELSRQMLGRMAEEAETAQVQVGSGRTERSSTRGEAGRRLGRRAGREQIRSL